MAKNRAAYIQKEVCTVKDFDKKIEEAFSAIENINVQTGELRKKIDAIEGYSHLAERIALSCENYFLEKTGFLESEKELYMRIRDLMTIKRPNDYSLRHLGRKMDGGYIVLDDFSHRDERGICYSFGISDEYSFDEAISELGYDVYMYDHTIHGIESNNENLHFFPNGIAGSDGIYEGKVNSLNYYLNQNNHMSKKGMILKMDVEGSEWDFLDTVDCNVLDGFDQIIMELHGFCDLKTNFLKIEKGLEKLKQTHQCAWIHCNNYGVSKMVDDVIFTDAMEVLYLSKGKYSFSEPDEEYYNEWPDYPNWFMRCDYDLSHWNNKIEDYEDSSFSYIKKMCKELMKESSAITDLVIIKDESNGRICLIQNELHTKQEQYEQLLAKERDTLSNVIRECNLTIENINNRKDSIIANEKKEKRINTKKIAELEQALSEANRVITHLAEDNQRMLCEIEELKTNYINIPKFMK